MIKVRTRPEQRLVEFSVDGMVTQGDLRMAIAEAKSSLPKGRMRVLEEIISFEGMTPAALWTDLTEALPMIGDIERVAVVTDEAWIRATAKAAGILPMLEIKAFERAQIDAARAWLTGP